MTGTAVKTSNTRAAWSPTTVTAFAMPAAPGAVRLRLKVARAARAWPHLAPRAWVRGLKDS
jgi:hypothetical protein